MNKRTGVGLRDPRIGPAAFWRAWVSDERGSATVIVALTATGLMALLALGIDLGALFNARSEAQRAADAAALAGASAFLEYQQESARSVALERAMDFATSNDIRGRRIAPEDVTITVNLDSSTVRAHVRRTGLPTWFARLVGVDAVNVSAEATAWAGPAGAAQCVKPFAIPDMWEEKTQDLNQNRIWDEGERWRYEPENGDRYAPYTGPGGSPDETGYGSGWRDGKTDVHGLRFAGDYGRRITVKVTDPRDAWQPSFFLPWVLPPDPDQAACGSTPTRGGNNGGGGGGDAGSGGGGGQDGGPGQGQGAGWSKWEERRGDLGAPPQAGRPDNPGGGGGGGGGGGSGGGVDRDGGQGKGAARYRQNICSCNASAINLDTEYLIEPGNMVGPTYQGVQMLVGLDPDAYWDDRSNTVVSKYGMDSPRVVTVALFDPAEIAKPGRQYIRFNNFARIFIEEQASPGDPVTGRMLYYVPGVGSAGRAGQTTGSLVRVLQLIR
jgi:Flp pilus assembly protein TadG